MIPQMLIESGIPDGPFRLWCFLDGRHGDQGYDTFGLHFIAEHLGKQTETITEWAEYLRDLGLVRIDGEGTQKRHLVLLGNPSREGHAPKWRSEELPPVPRRHHPSGTRGSVAKRAEMDQLTRQVRRHNCIGLRRDGERCKRFVRDGHHYCKVHSDQDAFGSHGTKCPDQQESKLPTQQEVHSCPAGNVFLEYRNPLSSEVHSYEGFGLGDLALGSDLSSLSTEAEAFLKPNAERRTISEAGQQPETKGIDRPPALPAQIRSKPTIGKIQRDRRAAAQNLVTV